MSDDTCLTEDGAREIVARNGWALAVFATALGCVIMASTPMRWSAPVWADALRVPGSPPTWGIVIFAAGILLLHGCWRHARRPFHLGCQLAFLWCCAISAIQISAFVHDDTARANPIGIVVWCYMAYIFSLRSRASGKKFYA